MKKKHKVLHQVCSEPVCWHNWKIVVSRVARLKRAWGLQWTLGWLCMSQLCAVAVNREDRYCATLSEAQLADQSFSYCL